MSVSSDQVVVAGDATLYLANYGATVPAGLTAPGTAWYDPGYLSEDGATFSLSRQVQDINVWQSLDPVRRIVQSFTKNVSMTLRQFNPTNMVYALGGGSVSTGSGAVGGTAFGSYTWPDPNENPSRSVILDCRDSGYTFRFIFANMDVSGDVEIAANRNDALNLPITLTSLASATKPEIRSNAPGWTS